MKWYATILVRCHCASKCTYYIKYHFPFKLTGDGSQCTKMFSFILFGLLLINSASIKYCCWYLVTLFVTSVACYGCQNKMHTKLTPSTPQLWRFRAEWWPDLTWIRSHLSFTLFITCAVYSLMILFSRINTGLLYINKMSWQSLKKRQRKEHNMHCQSFLLNTAAIYLSDYDFIDCLYYVIYLVSV